MEIDDRNRLIARADALMRKEQPHISEAVGKFYERARKHDWEGAEAALKSVESLESPTLFSYLKAQGEAAVHIMSSARGGRLVVDGEPCRTPRTCKSFKKVLLDKKTYVVA